MLTTAASGIARLAAAQTETTDAARLAAVSVSNVSADYYSYDTWGEMHACTDPNDPLLTAADA